MENQNTPTPSGTSLGAASAGSGQTREAIRQKWVDDRTAAAVEAWHEVRSMSNRELFALLYNVAEDCGERAGDLTNHDDAQPDLLREACCLYVLELLKRHLVTPETK